MSGVRKGGNPMRLLRAEKGLVAARIGAEMISYQGPAGDPVAVGPAVS